MLTYKRVLLWMLVLAFAREETAAIRWAAPLALDAGTQPPIEALAARVIAVALNAALIYALLRAGAAIRDRRRRRAAGEQYRGATFAPDHTTGPSATEITEETQSAATEAAERRMR